MADESESAKFEQLYLEYKDLVRNVLYNMVDKNSLDDLTQEAFIKIWKGLPKFGFRSSRRTWIYRITMNVAIDHLRMVSSVSKLKPQSIDTVIDVLTADDPQIETGSQDQIQSALQALDEGHRSVVILFYFEELEIHDIARILDVPAGTVKSRLHHAREKLRERLIRTDEKLKRGSV